MGIIIKLTCSTQTGKKAQMIKSAPKISKSLNELKKKEYTNKHLELDLKGE